MTNPIIRQIVDRCHVCDSYLEVLRYVCSKMRGGRKTFLRLSREHRHAFVRDCFEVHTDNRKLYGFVMGGLR